MIFSAKLEFYLKWSLVPLSVIGMKPPESENENMSNSRNLFCMVAIASNELVQKELSEAIIDYDENAIAFYPFSGNIWRGTTHIQQVNRYLKSGDEIHFRFQPKMKKFLISFVSQLL